ncbi:hypothetical protein GQ457_06G022650 [Hibiscus cannabinus]
MAKNGFSVQFKGDVCCIFDVCGSKFAELKMKNNSFYLKLDVVCEHVYHAKDDVSSLWHRRMDHFNLRTLKYMQSNDFVTYLPMLNISDDKCDSCQLGKSHRLSFSLDGVKRANMKLELVHSDLCGPMNTSSMNGKVVATVVYLMNRLATKVVDGKTPFEAWSGSKPSVKHLRVFGSICYNHISANMRSKLDERAWRGIFVGYSSQSKGYRIYNLESKMIVVSRDDIFYEDSYWNWEKNDVHKHDLRSISEELVISKDVENGETSDWFDVAGTTDADEIDAMKSEISAIEKNGTWFLTNLPSGKRAIGGVDYGDTFAPVARLDTIKLLITIAGQLGWNVFHLDVKSAFLNGELEEDKQQVVAQSTAEAEYIAAGNQAIWLRNLLSDIGFKQESATVLLCDNKFAIAIAENPVQHGRTKHINVKFHAIREAEKNSLIKMEFCSSEMQVADLMTKALSRNRMLFLKHELGITNINLKVEC